METIEKLKEVVDNLNEKIWGEYGEHEDNVWYFFYFVYSSGYQSIEFEDCVLWDSNDEIRSYDEKKDDYEDLEKFVIKQFCNKGNKMLELNKLLKTKKKHGEKI